MDYSNDSTAKLYEILFAESKRCSLKELMENNDLSIEERRQIISQKAISWKKVVKILKELVGRNDKDLKTVLLKEILISSPHTINPSVFNMPQYIIFIKYGENLLVDAVVMERESKKPKLHGYWLFTIAGIIGQKNMVSFCKDFLHERSAESCIKFSDEYKYSNENVEKVYKEFLGKPYKVPNIDYPAFKKRFQKKLDAAMKKAKEEAQQPETEESDTKGDPARPFVEDRKADENKSPQNNTGNESGSLPWILAILAILAVVVGIGVARRKQR